MFRDISASALFMGFLAAFVGFASSFAILLQGFRAMGASEGEVASALMAISVAKGLTAMALSARTRVPLSLAWSTPGAALLIASGAPDGGWAEAVGAFILCAGLLIATGLFKPLARLVERIPTPIASALLAGVLLGLCLAPFQAIAFDPLWGGAILLGWLIGGRIHKLLSAPGALIGFAFVVIYGVQPGAEDYAAITEAAVATPILTWPIFTLGGFISIALPLYLVTMAGQNLPGAGVLKAHGYPTHSGLVFSASGLASLIAAPFGGHACNYAAITAALCMGEESHPEKARRYWAAISSGFFFAVFGLLAGAVTGFVALAPTILIEAVGGLALLGAFAAAAFSAFKEPEDREASAVTLLVTASGLSFYGVSGAFWGLILGGAIYALRRKGGAK